MKENLFRAELTKNGLTIPAFANKIGINKTTVYRWFDNPGTMPLWCIQKFREVTNVSQEDFMQIFFCQ